MGLSKAHVAALRLFTTAAYKTINNPLRDAGRTAEHPLPVTVYLLSEAIKRSCTNLEKDVTFLSDFENL